jgi:hypothetical protein
MSGHDGVFKRYLLLSKLRALEVEVTTTRMGELVIPEASLAGLTGDARRLLEHIGVPLAEPAGVAWVAVRLEAEKGAQMTLALV